MDRTRHAAGSQSAVVVYHLFREALRRGMTEAELRGLTGLRLAEVADFGRRVDAETLFGVWEILMRRFRDPGLPIRAVRAAQADPRSALSLLVEASGSVREAFEHTTRYGSAWTTIYSLRLQPWRDGGLVVTLDGLGTHRLGERCEAEYTVAEIVIMLNAYAAGVPDPPPVRFAHPAPGGGHGASGGPHGAPAATGAHRLLFGPGLRFGAPRTEVVISGATLALPLRTARPGLAALLAAQLDGAQGRDRPTAFSLRVRRTLLERLGRQPVTAASTARALVVSERTLHRRLAAEGTSLRGLLDETRSELAREMLDTDRYPVKEVASALGFASTRSLHRAFRRWTGTTPRGR